MVTLGRSCLKRKHFLADQILNLVFEFDKILTIMLNTVGVIRTPLIRSVKFGTSIRQLGPHQMDVSSHSQLLVQLFLAFRERGKVSRGLLLESRSRWIIVALLGIRHPLIILGI